MASWTVTLLVGAAVAVVVTNLAAVTDAELQYGYYDRVGCFGVENRVRTLVRRSFIADVTASAAMLRLAFHDCQVGPGGCDGSIMIEGNGGEMSSGNNFGVKRLDIINSVKADMEKMCPTTVSCADIIAMAGRDAVAFNGGPDIKIPLGRKDAVSSSATEADAKLPPATSSIDRVFNVFGAFGMTHEESVAILGAHTIGVGHCKSIQDRLQSNSPTAPNSLVFRTQLTAACAVNVFNIAVLTNDATQFTFDNQYFKDIQNGRGLFTVDNLLSIDPRTAPIVNTYAANKGAFFAAFQSAYVKLTSRALKGNQGSVRSTCLH
ncbi:peroxidase 29 isoform X1 [Physcomitrium patens]|uniref:Peroxidase n=3 Tax=Physcomitrium patens TaxID=3218 RepID=A0A7I4C8U0_PHYPA|nr:peroxidase 29-like isoform X1 [Physcomitrium patens]|eukprot:XP_024357732.1 peroxidase 29-like isoform X1 [Physcomitrella patens]